MYKPGDIVEIYDVEPPARTELNGVKGNVTKHVEGRVWAIWEDDGEEAGVSENNVRLHKRSKWDDPHN